MPAPLASSSILRVAPRLPMSTAMRSFGMRASNSTERAGRLPVLIPARQRRILRNGIFEDSQKAVGEVDIVSLTIYPLD